MGNMNIFSELGSAKRGGAARVGKQVAAKAKKIADTKKTVNNKLQKASDARGKLATDKAASELARRAKAAAKAAADAPSAKTVVSANTMGGPKPGGARRVIAPEGAPGSVKPAKVSRRASSAGVIKPRG
jgi:hypothetical protein